MPGAPSFALCERGPRQLLLVAREGRDPKHSTQPQRALSFYSSAERAPQPTNPSDTLTTMNLRIAAIRSGSEPVRKLSSGSFLRWLETPLACPKCDVTY